MDSLTLFNTNKCNLSCVYCCTDAGLKYKDELDFEEKKDSIKQAKELGARSINITGSGEPTLDEDFSRLVEYCRKNNLHVTIATNGTLIDQEMARFLYENRVTVYYKLNSLDKKTVDGLVGPNSMKWRQFDDTIKIPEGLYWLLNQGYGKKFTIIHPSLILESVMCKTNRGSIPNIARFAKKLGCPVFFERLIPTGRAREQRKKIELTEDEYSSIYKEVCRILGFKFIIKERLRVCHIERNPMIDARGNLITCFARSKPFGNIRTEKLEELWKKVKKANRRCMAYHDQLLTANFKRCEGITNADRNLQALLEGPVG